MSERVAREYALAHAEAICEHMRPLCRRIEIAGSIRRERATVKDIEIVAEPITVSVGRNLFGESLGHEPANLAAGIEQYNAIEAHPIEHRLVGVEAQERDGRRFKALSVGKDKIPVDLFIVLPPATWGMIFLIRTGSADFNIRMIERAKGLGYRFSNGTLIDRDGRKIPTPEEKDVFRALRVKYKEPKDRS